MSRVLFIFTLILVVAANIIMSSSPIGQPLLVQYGDGTGMLDFLTYYSGEQAATALTSLGPEGSYIYTRLLLIDFVFIIGTAIVFSMIMQFLVNWSGLPAGWRKLHWLGYIRSGFDAIENVLLLIGLTVASVNQSILTIAGIMTLLKWIIMYVYIAVAVAVLIIGIRNKVKLRK